MRVGTSNLIRHPFLVATLAAGLVGGACQLDKVHEPQLEGPSETGLSAQMTAFPDVLNADLAFIDGVYRALLGRDADPAGLANWLDALLRGAPRSAVAQGVWNSPEHRGLEVDHFYLDLLHRPADAAGRAGWVSALLAGASEADVQTGILSSPEYYAAHPDNAAFVEGLYHDLLGRDADPSGLASALARLQMGVSQLRVIGGILTSPEALGQVVDGYYEAFLRRQADASGLQSFLGQLLAGRARTTDVAVQILASPEFFAGAART